MAEQRRVSDCAFWDAALVMGILYTAIYGAMMGAILLYPIPEANSKTIDILAGQMTIIQTGIVAYFFGRTKSSDDSQRTSAQARERTDNTLRDIVTAAVPTVPKSIKADDVKVEAAGDVTVTK